MDDSSTLNDGPDANISLIETYNALAEAITGIAASENKDWALSIGHLLQRVRGRKFLSLLKAEINEYRKKGRIKDDYMKTDQCLDCLQQLLDSIDKDSPDEVRFSAMKAVFLSIASEKISSRDDPLPQQIMAITRGLSSIEILILAASRRIIAQPNWRQEILGVSSTASTGKWIELVLKYSGLKFPELIAMHDLPMTEKKLLSKHTHGDRSGFFPTDDYRLTKLGFYLCEFIENYNELINKDPSK